MGRVLAKLGVSVGKTPRIFQRCRIQADIALA